MHVREAQAQTLYLWRMGELVAARYTIEAQLFSTKGSKNGAAGANSEARPLPEWAQIHSELQGHKHLTLQLV
ncbi:MAG TPA: hypothetical protein VMM84_10845, partial [Pyrinomonadaceae bacterium]|nr:hypothetical protein [Pyrinomonadaceae bacterium]